jgi:hypothetical protein
MSRHQNYEKDPNKDNVKQKDVKDNGKVNPLFVNPVTKNYPGNALRPLEISQATYEALLLIFMNDMGSDGSWFSDGGANVANNEYMKALGTFILGEPLGEFSWPRNWLSLLYAEFEDVKFWARALQEKREDNPDKLYVGFVLEAMIKRTVLHHGFFNTFITGANPVKKDYANKEAGSQKSFPSSLTTRRVLEPLIIPYRKGGMYGDCNPLNPATNIEALKKWFPTNAAEVRVYVRTHSPAFVGSMIDFYKANIFPDPELFLPYMIALSPSLRNAQLAIEEYQEFAKSICAADYDDCCDPFLSYLTGKKIPAIPNFEKNYLLLIEKFNFNRDYLKVSVGPIIQNMVLPLAIRFGVFSTAGSMADRKKLRAKAQRENGHQFFTVKRAGLSYVNVKTGGNDKNVKFWHAIFKNLVFSYQDAGLMYFPHWLYACSSRYISADAALRDRDFVVINVESTTKRAYLVRWCNIKNFLTRDSCNLAVLLSRSGEKVEKIHLMAFQDYIQMIPRPQGKVLDDAERASFTNCFEKVCAPNTNAICYPGVDAAPLPDLPNP